MAEILATAGLPPNILATRYHVPNTKRHLSGGSLGPFCTFHAKNLQVVFVLEILAALGALKRIGESPDDVGPR